MKNANKWNSFSRGLCVALLAIAAFCGICGLGAALPTIPWLWIAGGICLLLILSAMIWFLGYQSKQVSKELPAEMPKELPTEKPQQAATPRREWDGEQLSPTHEG